MIWLVRHGQTDYTLAGKLQGRLDTYLNEAGRKQDFKIAAQVRSTNFDIIFCSPLKRAKETCEIILNNNGHIGMLMVDDRIVERDYGEFVGTLRTRFDDFGWKINQKFERAETMLDLEKRVFAFLKDIEQKYKDKNILVVGHGAVNAVAMTYFEGRPAGGDYLHLIKDTGTLVSYQF